MFNLTVGLFIIFVILIILVIKPNREYFNEECVNSCVKEHSFQGSNYKWLNDLGHGSVQKIEFEQPLGSNKWTVYDDSLWKHHCDVVEHSQEGLVDSHMKAYSNPVTRFSRMKITFADGIQLEPTEEFYKMEKKHFKNISNCTVIDPITANRCVKYGSI
jgi:hypothetical protein